MKALLTTILLLLLAGSNELHAQKRGQAAIDSLLQQLPKAKEDTNKVNALYKVGALYMNIDLGTASVYGRQMLQLAAKLDWKSGIAKANVLQGVISRRKGDFSTALTYFSKSLTLYQGLADKSNIAACFVNMANVYSEQGNRPNALNYYFKALKIYEEQGNKMSVARYSSNIGLLYNDEGNHIKALQYYFKAQKIFEDIGARAQLGILLGNIGLAYSQMDEDKKAIGYYTKAIEADKENEETADLAIVTGNLGHSYVKLKDYAMGIRCIEQAIAMDEELGEMTFVANNLQYLGSTYVALAQDTSLIGRDHILPGHRTEWAKKAITYLQRGLAISRETNFRSGMQNCYAELSDAYRLTGDYKHAMLYSDSFYVIRDSVYSNDSKVKMANLAAKREEELKEKQIAINKLAVEKKRNERISFSIGLGLMLVIVSGLFVSRKTIKKEKNISENLLLNILPAEVAEELKAKGSADAKLIDEVTVLFTDFKGFTQLSEKLSPRELVAEINECFSAFDQIMHKHGVEKIKTIGDAYMAAGGLPTPNKTHPEDVVKAALEIQQYMRMYRTRKETAGELFFEARIGVHTGAVVAGIVGIKKFQYDIWGDTVNTASRMESSGEAGRVNISQATYELVKDQFECAYRGEVEAKNKGPMKMYFVS